jgi:hypothetical protein
MSVVHKQKFDMVAFSFKSGLYYDVDVPLTEGGSITGV